MAENTIPTPPATPRPPLSSPDTKPTPSAARLDALLEQYLDLLDSYTTLRAQLSRQLSDGFLSLARANHTAGSSALGGGRRFGEDGYDERMKASLRVRFEVRSDLGPTEEEELADQVKDCAMTTEAADSSTPDKPPRISIHPYTPALSNLEYEPEPQLAPDEQQHQHHQPKPDTSPPNSPRQPQPPPVGYRNPLTWYTLLPPPILRASQSCFTTAVESSIPALINAAAGLRDLEAEIKRCRTGLGLPGGVEESEKEDEEGKDGNNEKQPGNSSKPITVPSLNSRGLSTSTSPSANKIEELVHRPTVTPGPRSRTLKPE